MITMYASAGWPLVAAAIPATKIAADSVENDLTIAMDKANRARLESGEVLVFKKCAIEGVNARGHTRVIGLINRPWTEAWNQLTREREYPDFMPFVKKVEIYFEKGNRVGLRETTRLAFMTFCYHIMQTRNKAAKTISWELDTRKENDIAATEGNWVLRPVGKNRCLAVFTLDAQSKTFVPKSIVDLLLDWNVPTVVRALKERVEGK